MNFSRRLLIAGAVLVIFAVWMSTVAEAADDAAAPMDFDLAECKKVMGRIAKRTLKAFGKCSRELRTNTTGDKDEFEKKLGCDVKCTLFTMDILDENGKVTREKIQKFMDEMIPQDAHEFAHALAADCNESYGAKLDPKQEYCESYNEYAQCMQNTIADFADKTNCHPGGIPGTG